MRRFSVLCILLASNLQAVRSEDSAVLIVNNTCPPGANCTGCGICHLNDTCDVKTGFCPRDCAPGYKGKGCNIYCNPIEDCQNPCPCQKPCQCDRQRFVCNTECEELIIHGDISVGGAPSKTVVYLSLGLACGLIVFAGCFMWKSDQCLNVRQSYIPDVRGDGPHNMPFNSPLHLNVARPSVRRGSDPGGGRVPAVVANEADSSGDSEENRRKKNFRKDRRFAASGMPAATTLYPFQLAVLGTERQVSQADDVPFASRALSVTWLPALATNADMEDTRSTLETMETTGTPETLSSSSRKLAAVCGSTDTVCQDNTGASKLDSTHDPGMQRPPCAAGTSPGQRDPTDTSQEVQIATDTSVLHQGGNDLSRGQQGPDLTSRGPHPTHPSSDQSRNRVCDAAGRESSDSHPSDLPPDESLSTTGQRSPEASVKQHLEGGVPQQGDQNVLQVLLDSPLEGILPAPQPLSDADHTVPSGKD